MTDPLAVLRAAGVAPGSAAAGIAAAAVLVAMDARMGEVYAGYYRLRSGQLQTEFEALCRPEDLLGRFERCDPLVLAGHGFAAHPALRAGMDGAAACFDSALPDARHLASKAVMAVREGSAVEAHMLEPVYLRDEVANRSGHSPN